MIHLIMRETIKNFGWDDMNKKAIFTPITAIFMDIVFIVIWIYFLGSWLTLTGNMAISTGATGLEAFFYANLNLWVFIGFSGFNAMVFGWGSGN